MVRPLLNSSVLVFFLSYGLLLSFSLLPVKSCSISSSIICEKLPMQQIISALEDTLKKLKTRSKVSDYSTTPVSSSSVTNTNNISAFICQHCKLYEVLKY